MKWKKNLKIYLITSAVYFVFVVIYECFRLLPLDKTFTFSDLLLSAVFSALIVVLFPLYFLLMFMAGLNGIGGAGGGVGDLVWAVVGGLFVEGILPLFFGYIILLAVVCGYIYLILPRINKERINPNSSARLKPESW